MKATIKFTNMTEIRDFASAFTTGTIVDTDSDEITRLTSLLAESTASFDTVSDESKVLSERVKSLKSDLIKSDNELITLNATCTRLSDELISLNKAHDDVNSALCDMDASNVDKTNTIKSLKDELISLNKAHEESVTALNDMKESNVEKATIIKSLEEQLALKKDDSVFNSTIEELKSEKEGLMVALKTANSLNVQFEKDLAERKEDEDTPALTSIIKEQTEKIKVLQKAETEALAVISELKSKLAKKTFEIPVEKKVETIVKDAVIVEEEEEVIVTVDKEVKEIVPVPKVEDVEIKSDNSWSENYELPVDDTINPEYDADKLREELKLLKEELEEITKGMRAKVAVIVSDYHQEISNLRRASLGEKAVNARTKKLIAKRDTLFNKMNLEYQPTLNKYNSVSWDLEIATKGEHDGSPLNTSAFRAVYDEEFVIVPRVVSGEEITVDAPIVKEIEEEVEEVEASPVERCIEALDKVCIPKMLAKFDEEVKSEALLSEIVEGLKNECKGVISASEINEDTVDASIKEMIAYAEAWVDGQPVMPAKSEVM